MSKSVKGTQTEKNLMKSFAGESQARNRYEFFAKIAIKEGYEQIAAIFMETADNEKQHAKEMFKHLQTTHGIEITAMYPAPKLGKTKQNLIAAADGEHEEFVQLYPEFAKVAEKEGFPEIASLYRHIAKIEKEHEARYRKLAENIATSHVFKKAKAVKWQCRKCGHEQKTVEAPKSCPTCHHEQAYFQIKASNY